MSEAKTLYFTSHSTNGRYYLDEDNSTTYTSISQEDQWELPYWIIIVYILHENEEKTQIVSRTFYETALPVTVNIDVPETSVDSSDRLLISVTVTGEGAGETTGEWILEDTFGDLGESVITEATWTFIMYVIYTRDTLIFYFGSDTYPSRVEGIMFGAPMILVLNAEQDNGNIKLTHTYE